ncbi:O-antigen ligase family protein [Micromonospora sp. WMMD1155]|uniref:O-antigen ligase family protein n=1 Tax=Micromonospora sp. WMMD1155 TaxID=3016094 RepID=UPI00249BE727|nr:O-antigen ligase family protein [Micromonospora sp. WMMD1155]WFE50009.1 O-antigen ligase family protein [Micromonospora sp. WMMD1155]
MLFLAVPQFYLLPEGSTDVAASTVVTILLVPGVLLAARRGSGVELFRLGLFRVLIALLVVRLLALAWSPDPRAGLPLIALLGQFVVTLTLMVQAVRQDDGLLRRIEPWYWPWIVVEALLVLVFRVLPGVEDAFLRSIAGLVSGQNTVAALFTGSPNNVFDEAKSGGVFVNANVAGLFLGVNAVAAFAIATITGSRWTRMVGFVALAAVPVTGSKSATLLAVALPASVLAVRRLTRARRAGSGEPLPSRHGSHRRPVGRRLALGLVGTGVLGVVGAVVLAAELGFLQALAKSFGDRTAIWGFGAEAFLRDPLLGLGYGGWDAGFAAYAREHGIYRSFPPHNVLLAGWAATGLAGLVLIAVFFALTLRLAVRAVNTGGHRHRTFALWATAAVAWTLIHGLGDNTEIFGDIHLIPILSLLVAYLVVGDRKESNPHATPHRRDPETSTIPAVRDVHSEPGLGDAQLPSLVRGPRPGPGPTGN